MRFPPKPDTSGLRLLSTHCRHCIWRISSGFHLEALARNSLVTRALCQLWPASAPRPATQSSRLTIARLTLWRDEQNGLDLCLHSQHIVAGALNVRNGSKADIASNYSAQYPVRMNLRGVTVIALSATFVSSCGCRAETLPNCFSENIHPSLRAVKQVVSSGAYRGGEVELNHTFCSTHEDRLAVAEKLLAATGYSFERIKRNLETAPTCD